MKFDHIGIFVKDMESGRKYIKSLFFRMFNSLPV